MISRFAFAHVMNRYLAGARSPIAIVVLLVALFLVVEHPEASLAAIFVSYAISGPLLSLARMTIGRPRWADDEEEDEDVVVSLDDGERGDGEVDAAEGGSRRDPPPAPDRAARP